jgi:predicted transcriptional regulator YdeE
MESYSHGAFQVSGYKVRINNKQSEQSTIQAAWQEFMDQGLFKQVENKAYPHVHAIYYNYKDLEDPKLESYDMLLGFVTTDGTKQTNNTFIDLEIPAQDYMYTKATGNFQEVLPLEWAKINSLNTQKCPRDYGYDMEMYSEDYKTVTIAVSVIKLQI